MVVNLLIEEEEREERGTVEYECITDTSNICVWIEKHLAQKTMSALQNLHGNQCRDEAA